MYFKNISLHLAYLQTNEKKIIFIKKKLQIVIFLNKTFKSSIWLQNSISSKFFKNLCVILYSSSRCNAEKVIYNL